MKYLLLALLAFSALGLSDASARVFIGGGVVVGAPYYAYPPYYAYYPPYPYPAYGAYPPYPPYPPAAYSPYPLPPPTQDDHYYQDNNGEYCREYTHTVTIDGGPKRASGHACRQPDGSWHIVD